MLSIKRIYDPPSQSDGRTSHRVMISGNGSLTVQPHGLRSGKSSEKACGQEGLSLNGYERKPAWGVTLLFPAKDAEHNNAVTLREMIERRE